INGTRNPRMIPDRWVSIARLRSSLLPLASGGLWGTDSGGTPIAFLPRNSDGRDGPRVDSRPTRAACQAPFAAGKNQAAARTDVTRLPSGSTDWLPGNARDSSNDSATPGCAANTPLNTDRKSVVAYTSRPWYSSPEPMPGQCPATRPPCNAPPASNIEPPVP